MCYDNTIMEKVDLLFPWCNVVSVTEWLTAGGPYGPQLSIILWRRLNTMRWCQEWNALILVCAQIWCITWAGYPICWTLSKKHHEAPKEILSTRAHPGRVILLLLQIISKHYFFSSNFFGAHCRKKIICVCVCVCFKHPPSSRGWKDALFHYFLMWKIIP